MSTTNNEIDARYEELCQDINALHESLVNRSKSIQKELAEAHTMQDWKRVASLDFADATIAKISGEVSCILEKFK